VQKAALRVALLLTAAAAGCATGKPETPGTGASMSLSGAPPAPPKVQFSGRFLPVANSNSGAAAAGSTRIMGTVRLLSPEASADEYLVEFEFTSERGSELLLWSIVVGRCGSGGIPLVPPKYLEPINVPTSGSVQVSRQFPSQLTPGTDYHVNLYANWGTGLSSAVGCANLQS
jgi:hypothetical protein